MRRLIAGLRRPRAAIPALPATVIALSMAVLIPMTDGRADYLYLKNGRIADGKFVTVEGSDYVFQSGGKLIRAAIKETGKMVVGYRGAPVCFRRHGGLRDCSGLLFALDPRQALIGHYEKPASGKKAKRGGWLLASRVPLDRIAFLEFKTSADGRLPLIRPGVKLKLKKSSAALPVVKADRKSLNLRLQNGAEKRFEMRGGVAAIRLSPPSTLPPRTTAQKDVIRTWHYFVPGMVQWRRGEKITGGVFMGAFAGLSMLAYQEFRHASHMAAKINRNPVELYFSSLAGGDRSAYTGHVNRYRALLGLQLVSYGLQWVHALGWWPFGDVRPADVPRPAFYLMPARARIAAESGVRLNWEWRF